jgi:hypothetical protein
MNPGGIAVGARIAYLGNQTRITAVEDELH